MAPAAAAGEELSDVEALRRAGKADERANMESMASTVTRPRRGVRRVFWYESQDGTNVAVNAPGSLVINRKGNLN